MSAIEGNLFYRIRPILFTVFTLAISHNLFFILLPISLTGEGYESSDIGLAMSMFAAGAILAGFLGPRIVLRVGHVRAFSAMAAALAVVAVIHGYFSDIWMTGLLRFIAGFCFITNFITLESWLNVLSDKQNRGRVFSVYQIFFAIGFGAAPFLLGLSSEHDPRLFGLLSVFLSAAVIIMSISRLPLPEIPEHIGAMKLSKLWATSPSGTISCFSAGLINATSMSLISLYAYAHGISGIWLSLVLGSYVLGGLLTQYPVGWMADRYDKRLVVVGLMVMGVVSNFFIILENFVAMPIEMLVILFMISGGAGVALFPLAVTQVFDTIDIKDAISATSTMQILLGTGGVIGPITAGYLMSHFGNVWLYYFLISVHAFVAIYLLYRKLFVRTETAEIVTNYQIGVQGSAGASVMSPQIEYNLTEIGNPELKVLLVALSQQPPDPALLIKTALESSSLEPRDMATHLVLALPKQSGELIGHLVTEFPDDRMSIVHSLYDFFSLRKMRINSMILEALLNNAPEEEKTEINAIISQVLEEAEVAL